MADKASRELKKQLKTHCFLSSFFDFHQVNLNKNLYILMKTKAFDRRDRAHRDIQSGRERQRVLQDKQRQVHPQDGAIPGVRVSENTSGRLCVCTPAARF